MLRGKTDRLKMDTNDKLNSEMKKFSIACQQLVVINNRINMLETRYNRAMVDDQQGFADSRRLQVESVKSVQVLICEYVTRKCEEIDKLLEQSVAELTFDDLCNDDSPIQLEDL